MAILLITKELFVSLTVAHTMFIIWLIRLVATMVIAQNDEQKKRL